MRDHESTDEQGAAHLARGDGFDERERPTAAELAEDQRDIDRWYAAWIRRGHRRRGGWTVRR